MGEVERILLVFCGHYFDTNWPWRKSFNYSTILLAATEMRSGGQKNLLVSATAIENQTRLCYTLTAVSRFFLRPISSPPPRPCLFFREIRQSRACSGIVNPFKVKIETVSKAESIKFAVACSHFPHFSKGKSSYWNKTFLWENVVKFRARRRSLILGGAIMYLFLLDVSTRSLSPPCPIAST